MADGATIVLPPQAQTLEPNDAGMVGRLGKPQRPRPPDWVPLVSGDGLGPDVVIDLGDGALEVGDDGSISAPAVHAHRTQDENEDFGENLASRPEFQNALARIASEVMEGVDSDEQALTEWIEQYNEGIELLGTKIEKLNQSGSQGRKRDISRANDSTLIEAIVKGSASSEAELCPAGGPAKVPTIGKVSDEEEQLARDFEDDLNYYLTDVASEYYPDTAMMLVQEYFCGIGYKKVYDCPIRRRPVSESVLPHNLVVSEAPDLMSAKRVTHLIEMTRAQLRRMQIAGEYADYDIGLPQGVGMGIGSRGQLKIRENEGQTPISLRPADQKYVIRECDTDLDIDEFGLIGKFERDAPWGLPLPYKVAVEKNTRNILGVWRNWRPADPLYLKRNQYVKFGLIPALGYYNWGLLQLLGNPTRNMRSILRLLITAGMFNNFPAWIKGKSARTSTNEFAPAPGEVIDIDLPPGTDLSKVVMPIPSKPIDPALVQVLELIKQDAMRLGGTVMLEVGEGRTNVPVGTVLAMIEQQTQMMSGVNKRNHRSQKEELHKLRELFAEDPGKLALMVRNRPRDPEAVQRLWDVAQEFTDLNLVPASDPNVPSSTHRLMLANVLIMLAQTNPQIYDLIAVHRSALNAIGADPDQFLIRPDQQPPPAPDPKVIAAIQKNQNDQMATQQKAQADADKTAVDREQMQVDLAKSVAQNTTQREVEAMKTRNAAGGLGTTEQLPIT
jgi:hypothetical protein